MMKCTLGFFETPYTPKALQKKVGPFQVSTATIKCEHGEKAKLQWKILWLWKVWGLQHFNKENIQKLLSLILKERSQGSMGILNRPV
jgi:hypothetical protein